MRDNALVAATALTNNMLKHEMSRKQTLPLLLVDYSEEWHPSRPGSEKGHVICKRFSISTHVKQQQQHLKVVIQVHFKITHVPNDLLNNIL